MRLANIYIEHPTLSLDQCFSYRYTQEELQPGMRVWVPFAHQRLVGFVDSLSEISEEEAARLPYQIREVLEVIDHGPLLNEELRALGKWMAQMYVASTISCYQSMLPKLLKPKAGKAHAVMEEVAYFDHVIDGLTPRQREVLSEMEQCGSMPAVLYRRQYRRRPHADRKGLCPHRKTGEAGDACQRVTQAASHTLTKEQQAALSALQQGEGHSVVVLHGVTGSGKSEVFLRYADQQVQQGKQVLFLVPEIALTPQMQRAVEARFGDGAAIYHSHLSDQQKYEQYQLVARGKVQVVVGTRSAIFLPFARLGAIILDEEHDTSYKQENAPRYHCRDIAIWRGRHRGCKVILASATPSLKATQSL
ncbi:MAG: DEAD/DEAH box helicase [Merdibacter sp.]